MKEKATALTLAALIAATSLPNMAIPAMAATVTDPQIAFRITDESGSRVVSGSATAAVFTDEGKTARITGSSSASSTENTVTFYSTGSIEDTDPMYYELNVPGYDKATGSFTFADGEVQVKLEKKESPELKTSSVTAEYGDAPIDLTSFIETGSGYDGTVTMSMKDGDDIAALDGTTLTVNKTGTAHITVTAPETAQYAGQTAVITVTVEKKKIGTIEAKDIVWAATEKTYDGESTMPLSGTYEKDGVTLHLTAKAVLSGKDSGTYKNTKLTEVKAKEDENYDYEISGNGPTVTVNKLHLSLSGKKQTVTYGSKDWESVKNGSIPTSWKTNDLITVDGDLSSAVRKEAESINFASFLTPAVKSGKYNVGTASGALTFSVDKNESGNFILESPKAGDIDVAYETDADDKALWEKVVPDEAASTGTYKKDQTIYVRPGGYAAFKTADTETLYDKVNLQAFGGTAFSSGLAIDENAEDGSIFGEFYLSRADDDNTRTDADADKDGAQNNNIPENAVIVDGTAPQVEMSGFEAEKSAASIETRKFDREENKNTTSTVKVTDTGSGVAAKTYKILRVTAEDEKAQLDAAAAEDAAAWEAVPKDGTIAFQDDGNYILLVYARDNVGNAAVYTSDGLIIDRTDPSVTISGIDSAQIYNTDVPYSVTVSDPGDVVSGITSVKAVLLVDGEEVSAKQIDDPAETLTDSYELTDAYIKKATGTEGSDTLASVKKRSSDGALTFSGVISSKNNSNDIVLRITATDAAGNSHTEEKNLVIDTEGPAISVVYDNNDAKNEKYYNKARTATVTVTERNFDPDKVNFKITGSSAQPEISGWETGKGKKKDKNTCTVTFKEDSEYTFTIEASDKIGNTGAYDRTDDFIIDTTAPVVDASYTGKDGEAVAASADKAAPAYKNSDVTAVLHVTDKNLDSSSTGVTVNTTDAAGNKTDAYSEGSLEKPAKEEWKKENESAEFTMDPFTVEANYEITYTVTDLAGNTAEYQPHYITIDKTAPTASLTASAGGETSVSDTFYDKLRFWLFDNKGVPVTQTSKDTVSGMASVKYYIYHPAADTKGTFDGIPEADLPSLEWSDWNGETISIDPEQQAVVYGRFEDKAGNVTYVSTKDAVITENTAPKVSIDLGYEKAVYNSNVPFSIHVTDPKSGDTYAGLKSVSYQILNNGKVTQSGSYDSEFKDRTGRKQELTKSETVNAAANNSNHVTIRVTAVDYAGNTSVSEKTIAIDVTAPVIEVTYDNNSPANGKYYSSTRTATVRILERNFDPSLVNIRTTSTGSQPVISSWSVSSQAGESDSAANVCTITYAADADYTFTVDCTDKAGNAATYGRTDAFTIDRTAPVISVVYDNNDAANGSYYKAARTASITVREHNFDPAAFTAAVNAAYRGAGMTAPSLGGWVNSGDNHTAAITFAKDGDYSYLLNCTDLAGNKAEPYSQDRFTIDRTSPTVTFFDVNDKAAYNGVIAPGVRYTDTNATKNIKLTLSGKKHAKKDVTGTWADITDGYSIKMADILHKISEDDVYTLTAEASDLAGNVSTKTVTFSVNRFGSNFTFDDETEKYMESYYHKKAEDLTIFETNVDKIVSRSITLAVNGSTKTLKEGVDYTVEEKSDANGWHKYEYVIKKTALTEEGIYEITIESKDAAGNTQNNEIKDADIGFVVDKTAPSAVITGVEDGGRYMESFRRITINVADNVAMNKAVLLIDGDIVKTFTAEDIAKADGKLTYDVNSAGTWQTISVVSTDATGNETETSLKALITPNALTQFINNKLALGLTGAIAAAIAFLLAFAKKKKKKEEEKG